MRKKRILKLSNGREVKIKYKSPFVGMANVFGIKVDYVFYKELTSVEQEAVIWHELFHKEKANKIFFLIKTFFNFRKAAWLEEFAADKYAAENFGKENTLRLLRKIKKLYGRGLVNYNPKTHPPIDERIKRIKEIKLK